MKINIHKTARDYALKHKAPLGRYGEGSGASTGYYFLSGHCGPKSISIQPTAKSAIAMMRKNGFK